MKNSGRNNHSEPVSELSLLGFPCTQEIQILLLSLFSVIYVLASIGNLCIICAVWCDHYPAGQFFFPRDLSSMLLLPSPICQPVFSLRSTPSLCLSASSSSTPSPWAPLRPSSCLPRLLTGILLSAGPCTTHPTVVKVQHCIRMCACSWMCSFSRFLLPVYLISQLLFGGPNTIHHFFYMTKDPL